ncbi:cellulose biosynthesis cyclic di-GMP-binding regulatory protein BcsB [Paraferrimonas sp. SM1919]|uniref:cellulose biosynthesis cyclic di-GMP-binding regulatory protein BcsB n=1 Tax=Paraferrimonas sp. SM1919 TaxID=2662263 RepID=UPI0013CFEA6E|nr:cellulose biosynthesis cyclic di-GMP-binding regulatory protein BcsB [Paraferrimonas sp. SM1919]
MDKFLLVLLLILNSSVHASQSTLSDEQKLKQVFVEPDFWGIPYPQAQLQQLWLDAYQVPVATAAKQVMLKQLNQSYPMRLQGNGHQLYLNFSNRLDQIIVDAKLNLKYMYSPTLLANQSQIKVYLNDNIVAVISIDPKQAGKQLSKSINLPSYKMSDYNQLRFELVAYYDSQCHNPNHNGLWFELHEDSALVLKTDMVSLSNDLSLLPAPFIDERDSETQQLTFVLPKQQPKPLIHSAGQLAAWAGQLAHWRKVKSQVLTDQLPQKHAVVLATNELRPFFLENYPEIKKPTVAMVSHPLNSRLKLLLVLGKDLQQLQQAAKGLAMGYQSMSGQAAEVLELDVENNMKPYQAPRWIVHDRPMKLIEMVASELELQQKGQYLQPIDINMHIPADLFIWETYGVPIDINYRYSQPPEKPKSMLNVFINDYMVQSIALNSKVGIAEEASLFRLPFTKDSIVDSDSLFVPSFKLGINNKISFDFDIHDNSIACISEPAVKLASIDSESTIDFSGFHYYAQMPNISSFSYSGLPFTRMADLSQTAFVIPERMHRSELELLFDLLAHMSAITGYPGINFELWQQAQDFTSGMDIILLNQLLEKQQKVFDNDQVNVLVQGSSRSLSLAKDMFEKSSLKNRFVREKDPVLVSISNQSYGDMAAMTEFQSPFDAGRTVLSIMADRPENLVMVSNALRDPGKAMQLTGASVLLHKNKIIHSNVGDKYYVGSLPVWDMTRYHLGRHPVYIFWFIVFSVLVLSVVLWRLLRFQAQQRKELGE